MAQILQTQRYFDERWALGDTGNIYQPKKVTEFVIKKELLMIST